MIGGVKPYVMSSELERDGFMGVVEWRPNDRFHSTIDAFYSKFENTQILRGIEFPLFWGGSSETVSGAVRRPTSPRPRPAVPARSCSPASPSRTASSPPAPSTTSRVSSATTSTRAKARSRRWAGTPSSRPSTDWSLMLDLNYSKVERNDIVLETYAGTGRNIDWRAGHAGLHHRRRRRAALHQPPELCRSQPDPPDQPARLGWRHHSGRPGRLSEHPDDRGRDEGRALPAPPRTARRARSARSISASTCPSARSPSSTTSSSWASLAGDEPGRADAVPAGADRTGLSRHLRRSSAMTPWAWSTPASTTLVRNPNADVLSGNWVVNEKVNTSYVKRQHRPQPVRACR